MADPGDTYLWTCDMIVGSWATETLITRLSIHPDQQAAEAAADQWADRVGIPEDQRPLADAPVRFRAIPHRTDSQGVAGMLTWLQAVKAPTVDPVEAGTVVHRPEPAHHCRPGWRWRTVTDDSPYGPPAGSTVGIPPTPHRYPDGTLWQCGCGIVWVSLGSPGPGSPGICRWQREGRIARWRRLRRQGRAQGAPS